MQDSMTSYKEEMHLIEADPEITERMTLTAKILKTVTVSMLQGMKAKSRSKEKNKR